MIFIIALIVQVSANVRRKNVETGIPVKMIVTLTWLPGCDTK
jgi:hypothetical protein